MMSHDNLTWTGGNVGAIISVTAEDRLISYLPLRSVCLSAWKYVRVRLDTSG